MKRKSIAVFACFVFAVGGFGWADDLLVNDSAAMGGTTKGLQLNHDNSSKAYVQDDSPDGETIYRFTFLFLVGPTGATKNFRQAIFRGWGPNPNPGVGACPADGGLLIPSIQLWLYEIGGTGENPTIQLWGKGNQCGDQGGKRIAVTQGQEYRICGEMWTGPTNTGGVGLAIVNPGDACPSHGDPAYSTADFSNNLRVVDMVRMGTPATNTFGAGENMIMYYDEFASFRTLNP